MAENKKIDVETAARVSADDEVIEVFDEDRWNDARLYGVDGPEWQAVLDKAASLTLFESEKVKKAPAAYTATWRNWLGSAIVKGAGGFTHHPISRTKSGPAVMFGSLVDRNRRAKGVEKVSAMGLDIDSGEPMEGVRRWAENEGIAVLLYPTFNDMGETTELNRDAVLKALKIGRNPTDDEIQTYLRDHYTSYLRTAVQNFATEVAG